MRRMPIFRAHSRRGWAMLTAPAVPIQSRADLYRDGGEPYVQFYRLVFGLPAGEFQSAVRVLEILLDALTAKELDERLTTQEIIERIRGRCKRAFSVSFIQKGLRILERLGIIGRKRYRGRRLIGFLMALAGRKKGAAKDGDDRATVDVVGSNSNPEKEAPAPAAVAKELPADLAGAVGLLPGMSREKLTAWVALVGEDLVRRGVAWARVWLLNPRPELRPRESYWLEKTLIAWRRKIDAGEQTLQDVDDTIAVKVRKWAKEPARTPSRTPEAAEAEEADKARELALRGQWAALSEGEREEIRRTVRAATPGIHRLGRIFEAACLAEMERRSGAGPPEPPRGP